MNNKLRRWWFNFTWSGRTIDMSRRSWGHTVEKVLTNRFVIWCTPAPQKGDDILLASNKRLRITEVKAYYDPSDMFCVTVKEVPYV